MPYITVTWHLRCLKSNFLPFSFLLVCHARTFELLLLFFYCGWETHWKVHITVHRPFWSIIGTLFPCFCYHTWNRIELHFSFIPHLWSEGKGADVELEAGLCICSTKGSRCSGWQFSGSKRAAQGWTAWHIDGTMPSTVDLHWLQMGLTDWKLIDEDLLQDKSCVCSQEL